jgi:hypothetical protein
VTRGARTAAALALLLGTTVALAGCAPSAGPAEPAGSVSSDPAGSESPAPIEHAESEPDPAASTDAVAAAVAAVTAYCRPAVAKGEWMSALSPLLTDAAVVAYGTVDPATVPCTSYTGDASVRDGDDAFTFRIYVPTDAGIYEAYVTRPVASAPWLVERMAPPE